MDDFKNDPKYLFKDGKIFNRVNGEVIPAEEPVMVFRGRDIHALNVINHYHNLCEDDEHKIAVEKRFNEFLEFSNNHPERMKEPDTQLALDL